SFIPHRFRPPCALCRSAEFIPFLPDPMELVIWPKKLPRGIPPIANFLRPEVSATRAPNQEPRTKNQEPRTKNQEPRTKNQEPRTKNQEPRTKNQEPRTKRDKTGQV